MRSAALDGEPIASSKHHGPVRSTLGDSERMKIISGMSTSLDVDAAIAEATAQAAPKPDVVFCFASAGLDPDQVAAATAFRFPESLVIGCTTAGEIVDGKRQTGGLAITAIESPETRWAASCVLLAGATAKSTQAAVDELFDELAIDKSQLDPRKYVCLLFIDGLSAQEEAFASLAADALHGIPLVGGSAGDDLSFRKTFVFFQGAALGGHAVMVLCKPERGYDLFKHQHFLRSTTSLAVTAVGHDGRRILEFDGRPAADAYADAVGIPRSELTKEFAFLRPLTLSSFGDLFVRSVREIHEDGAISFFCAVEEGMVLDVARHQDFISSLDRSVDEFLDHHQRPQLFFGFNCILRAVESAGRELGPQVATSWRRLAESSVGFDTYGEQFGGLHINQTLVGVALH